MSTDRLQNNAQHRKMLVKNKNSYLRAFDPARPPYFEPWVQRDMQKKFTGELPRLRAGRYQFCGSGGSPTRRSRRLRWRLGGNTPAIGASATKRLSIPSLLPKTWMLEQCPTNSSLSLRRRKCSSRKAVPSCACIA